MPLHLLSHTSPSTALFRPVRPAQNPYRRNLTKLCTSCAALWLVTGALGILGIAPGLTFGVAHAEDFIIDTEVTTTNGGHTINGNDSLTVAETGVITTTHDYTPGILAPGGNNTITNRGSQQAESRWADSYTLDTNGAFAGLHGSTSLGMFAFDFGAVGGRLTHDSDRFVNDNLAPLGVSWASASYNSWFFNPEVGVSTAIDVARVTITPALRLAYAQQWVDSYSETGSNANASVGAQSLALLTASAEIKIEKQISENATVSVTGDYLTRKNMGDEAANIQLVGISNAVNFGDTDSDAFTLGGGLSFNVGEHASIGATITTFFGDTFTGTQGMATVKIRF